MIILHFFTAWPQAERAEAHAKTGVAILQFEEEDLFLDLDGKSVVGWNGDSALCFDEGSKLGVAVFHTDPPVRLEDYTRLLPRDADVGDGDVVVDPPTDVEFLLLREDDHVDRLGEALDVRLQH